MDTRIVTDSTCDLPPGMVERYGIRVIQNYINVGETSYLDGRDITHEDFYRMLPDFPAHPKTSAPGSAVFEQTYRQLIAEGARNIISMHIHSGISNLSNVARIAAESIQEARVMVIEVGQLALGLGYMAAAAAEAAANGKSVEEVIQAIRDQDQRTIIYAALDTLGYLKESGRAPALLVGLANVLHIKPIIQLNQGVLKMAGRERTAGHCVEWLIAAVKKIGRLEKLAVLHTNAPERAEKLRDQLHPMLQDVAEIHITEATPILGVHIGPQAIGLVCVKAPDTRQ